MRPCAELAAALVLGLTLAAAPAHAEGVPKLDERRAITESQAVIGRTPGDFTLLNRAGQPVRLADYRGKPLLVSFIYTGCFTICPTQTRSLHEAVKGLDRMLGPSQFNVVSVGFNQPFDSPQAMKAFAAQHRIDYPNWEFLSPHGEQVEALTRAYGFSYIETPAGFDHIVGVTVVDAQGRIHGQVYGDKLTAEALGVPLRELILAAPTAGKVPSFEELVERVRILCTVYDPDTGEYRYNWRLLFELIGGSAFFITAIVYLLRERQLQRRMREAMQSGAQGI
jgi:protein SCO1/2